MNQHFWLRIFTAFALLCALSPSSHAQSCFQKAGGVPGYYNQPPDWWDGGAPVGSLTNSFIDDPRWQGATAVSHISDSAQFRGLVYTDAGKRYLVVSWHVKADPTGNGDRLYFGVWDDFSHNGNVFSLTKNVGGTATPVAGETYAGSGFSARFYSRTDATQNIWLLNNTGGTTPPPVPDWLKNDARVDVLCPTASCAEWAFRLRIPIDPAADVTVDNPTGVKVKAGGNFRFWYQVQEESGLNTSVLYGWPNGLSVAQNTASSTCAVTPPYCFPDPLDATSPWLLMQDGASCKGDISIDPGEIYANTPGSITVSLSSTNHFHATPTNNTTSDQAVNAIKGTFRLADWGSVLFDSPAWTPICTDIVGTLPSGLPSGSAIASTHQFDLDCAYNVPDPCAYQPAGNSCGASAGSKNPDQCVLVGLGSASGAGPFSFSPQSSWQNMLFNGASTVEKVALLDTRGERALPVPAPERDLYVYFDVHNMPPKREPRDPPIPTQLSGATREKLAALKLELPATGGIGKATAGGIARAFANGKLSFDDVATLMPTYAAYVWYDTGTTVNGSAGTPLKRLEPQPGFGLFLWHDGDLYGWRHHFAGSTITELAPNFYRIHAPTDGAVKTNVSVTACETADCPEPKPPVPPVPPVPPPAPPEKSHLWLWLLLALLVILALVVLLRRK